MPHVTGCEKQNPAYPVGLLELRRLQATDRTLPIPLSRRRVAFRGKGKRYVACRLQQVPSAGGKAS
jgi:hypothetical protein